MVVLKSIKSTARTDWAQTVGVAIAPVEPGFNDGQKVAAGESAFSYQH
jgi:hypothetical protein